MTRPCRLRAPFQRLRSDQSGAVTVEMVFWFPVIVLILYLIADVSLVFHRQSEVLRHIQANNRAFATGRIDMTELQSNLSEMVKGFDPSPSITVTHDTAIRMLTTTVSIEAENLMAGGAFGFLKGKTLDITASHLTEL